MLYVINEYPDGKVLVYDSIERNKELIFQVVSEDTVLRLAKITKIMGVKDDKIVDWKSQEDAKNKLLGVKNPPYEWGVLNGCIVNNNALYISRYMSVVNVKNVLDIVLKNTFGTLDSKYIKFDDTSNLTHLFYGLSFNELNLLYLDTSNCTNMFSMFGSSVIVGKLKLGDNFSTDKVRLMREMFAHSTIYDVIDFTKLSSESLIDVSFMFEDCKAKEVRLGGKFTLNNIKYMRNMFELSKIKVIDFGDTKLRGEVILDCIFALSDAEIIDLSRINIDEVDYMDINSALYKCHYLKELRINKNAYEKIKQLVSGKTVEYSLGISEEELKKVLRVVD